MFWISGKFLQCLGNGFEQDLVEDCFIAPGDRIELMGNREDVMEILYGQKFSPTFFQPLSLRQGLAFWTMTVAAGILGISLISAVVTLLQMTSEIGGTTYLNGTHDLQMRQR